MKLLKLTLPFLFLSLFSCQPQVLDAVSTSFAKEYCSCLFVEKQNDDYCSAYAKQMIPIESYSKADNVITVFALGKEAKATFLSQKEGCQITKYPEA